MARNILSHLQNCSTSQVGFFFGSLFLSVLALFLCASHSRKWQKWKACHGYGDEDPVIQLNPERIQAYISGDDESTYSGEASLWKKNIIMGGKCQLPDFSGVIIYDTAGNLVPPAKAPRALPWK